LIPRENKKIFAEMETCGAIISEFTMGTFPGPQNFPIRNRVIAGMSLGVVVVEGAQYSGSLITARLAMEFGREVYGVPGNATQPTSFGPNQLIKQGTKLVTGWEDVIEELPTSVRAETIARRNRHERTKSAARRGEFGSGRTDLVQSSCTRPILPPGRASRTFWPDFLRGLGRPI
jgi:DNA processing protein